MVRTIVSGATPPSVMALLKMLSSHFELTYRSPSVGQTNYVQGFQCCKKVQGDPKSCDLKFLSDRPKN